MDEWGVAFGGCVVTPGRPWFACGGCGNRLTASGRGDRTLLQAFLEEVDRRYSRGEISATVVSEIRALYART